MLSAKNVFNSILLSFGVYMHEFIQIMLETHSEQNVQLKPMNFHLEGNNNNNNTKHV